MPVLPALAIGQGVLGTIQSIGGNERAKRLMQQRTAYKTPEEYFDILNAVENRAQSGFDAFTLNYLTNQTDRAFDSTLDAAVRLGADPNQLSAAFDQKMQSIMKIGSENARLNMDNFSRYLGALESIGESRTAEWQSQQDLLKDKQQAAAMDKQAGLQNIFGAANAFLANDSATDIKKLFTLPGSKSFSGRTGSAGSAAGAAAGLLPLPGSNNNNNPFDGMTEDELRMFLNGYFGK